MLTVNSRLARARERRTSEDAFGDVVVKKCREMEGRKRGSLGNVNNHLLSKHYHVPYFTSVSNETPAPAFHLTRVLL